jgi:hypothetical protein
VQTEQLQNCCLAYRAKFILCPFLLGTDEHSTVGLGVKDRGEKRHFEGGNIHMVQHKMCTCFYILLPIFVLSKLELLKIKSSLFYIVEKKLKI